MVSMYVGSIMDNSWITCDEIIEETKAFPTKSTLTKCTSTNFHILLCFY